MEGEKEEKSFKDLGVHDRLAWACDNLGWINPTKIQIEAIPHALEVKDIIGLAQTGSGKTRAFAIPILQSLLETPQAVFAFVLSATRELAIQIAEQFEALESGIGLKCAVVATPGRLGDHLSNTKGFSLRTLKYLMKKIDCSMRILRKDLMKY